MNSPLSQPWSFALSVPSVSSNSPSLVPYEFYGSSSSFDLTSNGRLCLASLTGDHNMVDVGSPCPLILLLQ